ncbi:MAG: ribulose-phosphate 3-epimerase [Candidatus Wallbacteria bacterium]|nr:ribulose-phosphate 3-epimerase [Candidatus Wallbacteria bacterium]
MIHITPSILNANLMQLPPMLAKLEKAGGEVLHLDVMDGHFVPPLTFGPMLAEALRSVTGMFLEAHLMVDRPGEWVEDFAKAGCGRIIVHAEATPHLHRLLGAIRKLGVEAGVAINPGTALSTIEEVLGDLDLVLVMTVNPGWGGQKFIPACIGKLERLKARLDELGLAPHLEVDGGINLETAPRAVAAGADLLVAGNAVFGAKDPIAAFRKLTATARSVSR